MRGLYGISPKRWLKLASWTIFGTLGCVAISVAFNALAFADFPSDAFRLSIASAIIIPIILAGPLFFYLTLKLRELAIVNHKLAVVASTDSLTSVLNRGAFSSRVDQLLSSPDPDPAHATGAFLLIDADHFKTINDRFGHDHGDEALRLISASIRASVRAGDIVGRLGGEEFGVFMPGATYDNAVHVAERIRATVAAATFLPQGWRCNFSVSIGGAAFRGGAGFGDLFRIADQRLYVAKHAGRNRASVEMVASGRIDGEPALSIQ